MKINNLFKLVVSIGVVFLAGAVGSFFTTPAIQSGWYKELLKPALNPPAWIFAPVWTALYIMMGISLFLIWSFDKAQDKSFGVTVFFVQLFLNALWSILFFGFQSPGLALAGIILLWIAILATIISFAKISKTAAYLLVPYILWVSFATYLNYSIWLIN